MLLKIVVVLNRCLFFLLFTNTTFQSYSQCEIEIWEDKIFDSTVVSREIKYFTPNSIEYKAYFFENSKSLKKTYNSRGDLVKKESHFGGTNSTSLINHYFRIDDFIVEELKITNSTGQSDSIWYDVLLKKLDDNVFEYNYINRNSSGMEKAVIFRMEDENIIEKTTYTIGLDSKRNVVEQERYTYDSNNLLMNEVIDIAKYNIRKEYKYQYELIQDSYEISSEKYFSNGQLKYERRFIYEHSRLSKVETKFSEGRNVETEVRYITCD